MTPKSKRNFYLDDDMIERLEAHKQKTGMPHSETVRRGVDKFLTDAGFPKEKVK